MICTFCGHSDCNTSELYPKIKKEVEKLIVHGVATFYSGGYGGFDMLALKVVSELQEKYPHIQNILVFAYLSEEHTSKYRDILSRYHAESIYPFDKKILPRFAIIKRNQWMIKNSDFVISATKFHLGGCGLSLEYAQKLQKNIIYI
ncbi:MAG: SLOG family protein [Bacillota bacterium]